MLCSSPPPSSGWPSPPPPQPTPLLPPLQWLLSEEGCTDKDVLKWSKMAGITGLQPGADLVTSDGRLSGNAVRALRWAGANFPGYHAAHGLAAPARLLKSMWDTFLAAMQLAYLEDRRRVEAAAAGLPPLLRNNPEVEAIIKAVEKTFHAAGEV
jgi:hypothetical protein